MKKFLLRRSIRGMAIGPIMEAMASDRHNYYCAMLNSSDYNLYVVQKKNHAIIPYHSIHITDKQMEVIENSRGHENVILNVTPTSEKFYETFRSNPFNNSILKVYTNKKYVFIRVFSIRHQSTISTYQNTPVYRWSFLIKFELV